MSGTKKTIRGTPLVVNGNMTSNIISPITPIEWIDNIGIQLEWTGSPVGVFEVLVSADHVQDLYGNVTNVGQFVPLTLTYLSGSSFISSQSVPTSVGSPIYFDLNQLSAPYIMFTYTASSSTGSLNAFITAKEV